MEQSDRMRLRGGRGAYDTTGVRKPKPPPKPDGTRVPKQTQWEEMNRRQRTREHFKNATPQSEHEIELLERAKSNEEQRRLRWDNDRKARHLATTSMPENVDAALPALAALRMSPEPTLLEVSNTSESKAKRALAGLRGSLKKPWSKPTESVENEEGKAKKERKEKKKVLEKKKKEKKDEEVKDRKEKEEKEEKDEKKGKNKRNKRRNI